MKKLLALLMAAGLLISALALSVSADFTYEGTFTDYDVYTASKISFSYDGDTSATAFPRGAGGTLECLIDGTFIAEPGNHDDKGLVLVCNDFIKPEYERKKGQAIQDASAIPEFSFTLEYDGEVTFDSIYLGMFYQAFDCVCAPGEHRVIVETSDDGSLWLPVGEDGSFYFRDNQPLYTGAKDPCAEEIVVYLGEEVDAKYVRLTFNFKQLDAGDDYWDYYTNVYEWCGFSELAVACYADGDEPEVMTKEYAEAPAVALEGVWYASEGEVTTVVDFGTSGIMKLLGFVTEDFEANGLNAEIMAEMECPYTAGPDYILVDMEGEVYKRLVELGEDTLCLDDGETPLDLELYVPAEDPGTSEDPETSTPEESTPDESQPEESDPVTSEPEESTPADDVSEDASAEESTPADTEDDEAEADDDATADKKDEGGLDAWVIVLIAVAAVAVVAVIVVVVLKKKKN